MKIENITTPEGLEIVNVFYEDGRQSSFTKAAWDELEANKENGTLS